MKTSVCILIFLIAVNSFSQNGKYEKWLEISKDDISLQPEYGKVEKNAEQKKADSLFVAQILEEFKGDRIEASKEMAKRGFGYLYEKGDFPTAMRRFNQAFLLDPQNPEIYYGYGTVYFNLGALDKARKQYDKGLKINPDHAWILTDYGTTYLGEYFQTIETNKTLALKKLDKAKEYLDRSYEIDGKNPATIHKLAIVNMYLGNCTEARKFLKKAMEMESPNITEAFKSELYLTCKEKNMDCSGLRTGKFKVVDKNGPTTITRTKDYQIEENKKLGVKMKFEIKWVDDCTYQLKPVAYLKNPDNRELPDMVMTCEITNLDEKGYMQVTSFESYPLKIAMKVLFSE